MCDQFFILGTSKQLGILIEGESLLNDGAGIVLFSIFLKLATPHITVTGKCDNLFGNNFINRMIKYINALFYTFLSNW